MENEKPRHRPGLFCACIQTGRSPSIGMLSTRSISTSLGSCTVLLPSLPATHKGAWREGRMSGEVECALDHEKNAIFSAWVMRRIGATLMASIPQRNHLRHQQPAADARPHCFRCGSRDRGRLCVSRAQTGGRTRRRRRLAALLAGRIDVSGKNVVLVLSGGNVDADLFAKLIA
jgi:hypothetical protein